MTSVRRLSLATAFAEEIGPALILYPAGVDPVAQCDGLLCSQVEHKPAQSTAAHPKAHSTIPQSAGRKVGVVLDRYVLAAFAWIGRLERYWRIAVSPLLRKQCNQSFEVPRG